MSTESRWPSLTVGLLTPESAHRSAKRCSKRLTADVHTCSLRSSQARLPALQSEPSTAHELPTDAHGSTLIQLNNDHWALKIEKPAFAGFQLSIFNFSESPGIQSRSSFGRAQTSRQFLTFFARSVSVISDRLDRAGHQGFFAKSHFFRCLRLFLYVRIAVLVATREIRRRCVAANVTVDTLVVNVVLSADVFPNFVLVICHFFAWDREICRREPAEASLLNKLQLSYTPSG